MPGHTSISIYRRLQSRETRLVSVAPAKPCEPLQCEVKTVSLDDDIEYDALSYVWGDTKLESEIWISGDSMPVPKNLASALHFLRCLIPGRLLWVDQICIDQQNIMEKNYQVSLMSSIYQKAVMTYAYLHRTSDQQNPEVVDLLTRVACDPNSNFKFEGLMELWFDLLNMVKHEWWERVWTMQEMVLARDLTLTYAGKTIPYSTLSRFFHVYSQARVTNDLRDWIGTSFYVGVISDVEVRINNYKKLDNMRQHVAKSGHVDDLVDLLSACQDRKATQLLDRVYGLAGLYPFPPDFVDYSLPAAKCLEQLAILLVKTTRCFNIFQYKYSDDMSESYPRAKISSVRGVEDTTRLPGLPSWVPDWTQRIGTRFREIFDRQSCLRGFFAATGSTTPRIKSWGNGELAVEGLLCGIVSAVDNENPSFYDLCRIKMRSWKKVAQLGVGKHDRYGLKYQKFRESLTVGVKLVFDDKTGIRVVQLNGQDDASVHDTWMTSHDIFDRSFFSAPIGNNPSCPVEAYDHTIGAFCAQRRFIQTETGDLGWAPAKIQPGDTICALFGSKTLSAIRPDVNNPLKWELLGDVYLHGYMHGEVLTAAENGRIKPSVFTLI